MEAQQYSGETIRAAANHQVQSIEGQFHISPYLDVSAKGIPNPAFVAVLVSHKLTMYCTRAARAHTYQMAQLYQSIMSQSIETPERAEQAWNEPSLNPTMSLTSCGLEISPKYVFLFKATTLTLIITLFLIENPSFSFFYLHSCAVYEAWRPLATLHQLHGLPLAVSIHSMHPWRMSLVMIGSKCPVLASNISNSGAHGLKADLIFSSSIDQE